MPSITAYAGTLANSDAGGDDWGHTGNAAGAADGSSATCDMFVASLSDLLKATNYDFSAIPADATIVGIEAGAVHKAVGGGGEIATWWTHKLVKNNVPGATNKATDTDIPTTLTLESHGGAADLWGTTWTVAQVKAANFGQVVQYIDHDTTNAVTASVDAMPITVYYTVPDSAGMQPMGIMN